MKDLTAHSIGKHILEMAVPIAAGMLFQTLYFLIDLYFVAHLGDAALAGVGAAGNVMFIVFALAQVLGVGTVALISHAVGRKNQADATRVFNQSFSLSALCGVLTLVAGYLIAVPYMHSLGADAATAAAGIEYLRWFLPSLGLQFAVVAISSALRGTGIVKPSMIVQVLTVILNAILAPVLIAGWGTGHPLGVAGAGLASSLASAVGVVLLALYFHRLEHYVVFDASAWRWDFSVWGRLLRIGLPAGGEFALMFLYMAVIYWIIRPFGQDAQAGFGIGMRLNQSLFLPAMAVAFATAPIVGQNLCGRKVRPRAGSLRARHAHRGADHGIADLAVRVARGVVGAGVHDGARCGRGRDPIAQVDRPELHCIRRDIHLLRGVPRTRQHRSSGGERRDAYRELHRAGAMAHASATISVGGAVVHLHRERDGAGAGESMARSFRVSPPHARCRAGTRGRLTCR